MIFQVVGLKLFKYIKIMKELDNLSTSLTDIQSKCIGLYQHFIGMNIELVVEEDEHTFQTVTIGDLFGKSTTTFGKDSANPIIYFEDNKTLAEVMKEPFKFNEWFCKNIEIKN